MRLSKADQASKNIKRRHGGKEKKPLTPYGEDRRELLWRHDLQLIMVFFAAVGTAIERVSLLAHYAPLIFLGNGSYLGAFTTAQLQAAAYVSLQMFDYGFMIALTFFGFFCLTLVYLIFRSAFFPRVVGGLLAIQGSLYLTNSFAHFVSPAVGARVFPFLALSGVAEISFCLWLLFVGVNVQQWGEQAGLLPR